MRTSKLNRITNETKIMMELNLDGSGITKIDTKVGFIDHMLTLLAFHGNFDLMITCDGDIEVDSHHSVEDIGIVLGKGIKGALGDKVGIERYGDFTIPMDEALVSTFIDISERPYLVFNANLSTERLGNYETEMTEEFFRAVAFNAGVTLHINQIYGSNTHHIIEAMFKSFGRALKKAITIDESNNKIPSSKGIL